MSDVRDAARRVLKRREWASKRGIATRAYLRANPTLIEQFKIEGTIPVASDLPDYVTRSSLILELNQRARRRETAQAAKNWIKEHPEQSAIVQEEIRRER